MLQQSSGQPISLLRQVCNLTLDPQQEPRSTLCITEPVPGPMAGLKPCADGQRIAHAATHRRLLIEGLLREALQQQAAHIVTPAIAELDHAAAAAAAAAAGVQYHHMKLQAHRLDHTAAMLQG